MGNPKRWYFNNQLVIGNPQIDIENKTLITMSENQFENYYENVRIDFYSAPDLILTYTNGNTCRNEWRRYYYQTFTNVKKVSENRAEDLMETVFSYKIFENKWLSFDDPETETEIPLGKFYGMTFCQVQNYKEQNKFNFRNS